MNETITLTQKHIERCMTPNGGFTKATFEALGWKAPTGEPWKWCPPKGWRRHFVGRTIPLSDYQKALQGSLSRLST